MTKCLIISNGPVPTPEHTKVEGGGLRCWGLAKGLKANDPELDITVAYSEEYKKEKFTSNFENIKIATWQISEIEALVRDFDTVIVSYCMGELSEKTAEAVRTNQQLILDCYVPIYVEVSARNSEDIDREYHAFHHDAGRWGRVLKRGDLFLCASEAQKRYYMGVLSGLGRINPVTYGTELIKIVPYGIYEEEPKVNEKPISKMLGKEKSTHKKILWFGGIYPWFNLSNLIDAVEMTNKEIPTKLVIVGAKNPFNTHPDFVRAYEELIEYVEADPSRKENVVFQDWVKYDDRADWYLDSDLVVVINKIGDENELAWRTRVVDYIWADLPIITNGGDPLGEILLSNKAAIKLGSLSSKAISESLVDALKDEKTLQSVKGNLEKIRPQFYWSEVTKGLVKDINQHAQALDLQTQGMYQHRTLSGSRIRRVASKAKMIPAYTRKYGAYNTYHVLRTKVKNKLLGATGKKRTKPGVVMIAHQLDMSGAPYVFMDLAESIVQQSKDIPVEFHTFNPAEKDNLVRLNKMGIKPDIHISKDVAIPFVDGDTIVLNTVAHSSVLKNSLYQALDRGSIKKLAWFIHEDEPELIFPPHEIKQLQELLKKDKVVMFIAAKKTLKNYQEAFKNTTNIRMQPYKYVIPNEFQKVRDEKDFDTLKFILPGTVGDGRKGQLPIFYALSNFYKEYYTKYPEKYRDFELMFVGISDDFASRQILKHADKLLGKKFKHIGRVSHKRSFELIMKSNVTICYSLRECLPLFVFEGMAAGHPLLRNDSSGIDEQLFEGKNGFQLESEDFNQVVETFERVLNKEKTTNKTLAKMSAYSNKVALDQANHSYKPMVDEIVKEL